MAYDLVAFVGPLEGERFSLEAGKETPIGRGARGIHLPDPLVSVAHARLVNDRDAWFIEDLGSATGTKVNGVDLRPNVRHPLQLGDVVAIGESQLRVDSSGSRVVRRLMWAMIPAWILVFLAAAILFWVSGEGQVQIRLGRTVNTPAGPSNTLVVPASFIREHALRVDTLQLRRVTDLDRDGVDELWLYHGVDELAVALTGRPGEEAWRLLGRFPKGCTDREEGTAMPDMLCQGITYRAMEPSPGAAPMYRAIAQNEPVAWLMGQVPGEQPVVAPKEVKVKGRKAPEPTPEAPPAMEKVPRAQALNTAKGPVPYRVSMGRADRLAGFLAARSVPRGAHYVLCEGAAPGVPAQALLEGGEILQLSQPCGDDLALGGPKGKAFEGARVVAVALTAVGAEALPRHLAYTWTGNPNDLFLDEERRAFLAAMQAWPIELVGGLMLEWKAAEHFFTPFASEAGISERVGLITDVPRPPDAIGASLLSRGRASIDPDGCAEVTVRTRPFRCALLRGCIPGTAFLEVVETGCGEEKVLVRTGYSTGIWDGQSDALDVRVELRTQSGLAVKDVIQARVGVRPR